MSVNDTGQRDTGQRDTGGQLDTGQRHSGRRDDARRDLIEQDEQDRESVERDLRVGAGSGVGSSVGSGVEAHARTRASDLTNDTEEDSDGEIPASLVARLPHQGATFNRRTPFYIGFTGALGVALAYGVARAVADIAQVLTLIGLSLFLAIGLEPAVAALSRRHVARPLGVIVIVIVFLGMVAGFVAAAVPPIAAETHQLTIDIPRYRTDLSSGKGWIGHLANTLHLTHVLGSGALKPKLSWVGGVLGAGKALLSVTTSAVSALVLTIYFLVALPSVRRVFLALIPRSRRTRVALLTDDVFTRVGGFVLGNLLTSVVTGAGTAIWLGIFGVPYPVLIGLFVGLLDLIPVVGSTVGGFVASLVALTKGLPVAIGTACFYIAYRLFEDYVLTPRVMRHTVRISPGLTIIATLIGASLLGLLGALVAIPAAATTQLILAEVTLPRLDRS